MEHDVRKTFEPSFGTIFCLKIKYKNMKKYLFLFLISCQFFSAQMPNISTVFLNNSKAFTGTFGSQKIPIKIKINIADQDKKNNQHYFVSGYTLMENKYQKIEGTLLITKYKDGNKRNSVYGTYEIAQDPKAANSGLFTGKFIYTFMWNKKTEKIEDQFIEFIGERKNYSTNALETAKWSSEAEIER